MAFGKLYGVSVGPGDPELLTLKAVRVLRDADVVAVPNIGHGRQTALGIIQEYVEGKPLIDCSTPMLRDRTLVVKAYRELADKLAAELEAGRSVAYVAIGDIGVYSTYFYVHEMLVERGFEAEVIPGITSFCASAARLGVPLIEGPETLTVVPVLRGTARDYLDGRGTKVFMKSGRGLVELRQQIEEAGEMPYASIVCNCGLEDEAVYPRLADAPADLSDYFTLVIVRHPDHD